ncbi:MAG: sensor histidine kinase [Alistipes sp.]|nr:sensor histidine kinase [Alistipes sp.]
MNLRKIFRNISLGENMVYALVWAIIYLIPFMNAHLMSEEAVDFGKVVISWAKITPYFAIFLVHNYCLSPLLLRNRYGWYIVLSVVLVASIFGAIEALDFRYWQSNEHLRDKASLTELAWYWNVLFGILMAGANSMIKLYYRAISAEQRMAMLERQNIESQMQYLKYQINPHFLMNTLNNIHSMIDFDKDMARKSVMDLSRMMRHVLYDSGEQTTTLDKEVEFLSNYIELMRIRYIDDIDISFTFPDMNVCRRVELPPLLLIVLVENAFKHGISYNQESHIHINLYVDDDELTCVVANSRHYSHSSEHSGIGLNNITRRLDLLFGSRYVLDIDDGDEKQYIVKLVIPVTP